MTEMVKRFSSKINHDHCNVETVFEDVKGGYQKIICDKTQTVVTGTNSSFRLSQIREIV